MAFDPIGPPPEEKTIVWTVSHLSNVVVPIINFDKASTLQECIDFLRLSRGAPPAYRVEIDGEALGQAKPLVPFPEGLQARDIKLIDVLAKIADAAQANLVIEEGRVRLVPKARVSQEAAPKISPAPDSK